MRKKKKSIFTLELIIRSFFVLLVINLLVGLTGFVIPWLISTNQLPLIAISLLVTLIVFFMSALMLIFIQKIGK